MSFVVCHRYSTPGSPYVRPSEDASKKKVKPNQRTTRELGDAHAGSFRAENRLKEHNNDALEELAIKDFVTVFGSSQHL